MKTIVSVCSARPNFVKLAAVHHALVESGWKGVQHVIVHTGQHYDPLLSDVFFEQLGIPQPDYNLGVHGGTREEVIANTHDAFLQILPTIAPDIVLVYGDVNGAVGAAQAAKAYGCRVAHVEAGLRSFDDSMPEEHNRIAIDQLADILFVSEESGMKNLEREGVAGERLLVGNVMIDTLMRVKPAIDQGRKVVFESLSQLPGQKFALATIHRPSNVDDPEVLIEIIEFLKEVSAQCPISLPPHPRLKKALVDNNFKPDDRPLYILNEPMPYLNFMSFLSEAAFIITDSGGIQEEAVFLGKRCFTLRRNTERPSTIESGSNVLIDPSQESDRATVIEFAQNPHSPKVNIPDTWDGQAGKRIVEILREKL